jgi:hypothetical protein
METSDQHRKYLRQLYFRQTIICLYVGTKIGRKGIHKMPITFIETKGGHETPALCKFDLTYSIFDMCKYDCNFLTQYKVKILRIVGIAFIF